MPRPLINPPRNVRRLRNASAGDPLGAALPALRHFAVTVGVFLLFCAIPYLHESMADYRYLGEIDASPLWRALTFTPPTSMQSTVPAVPGVGSDAPGLHGEVEELLARDPALLGARAGRHGARRSAAAHRAGHAESRAFGDGAFRGRGSGGRASRVGGSGGRGSGGRGSGGRGSGGEKPRGVGPGGTGSKGRTAAGNGSKGGGHGGGRAGDPLLGAGLEGKPMQRPLALRITAETLGDQKTWIEDPEHTLDPFYKSLVELAYGERDKVRVRHYGDSHLANDGLTHAIRVMLQRRFGDGGHGFTLVASRTQWYRHKGIVRQPGQGWKARNFLGGSLHDGAYGYGGVAALGQAGATFTAATTRKRSGQKTSRVELWFRGAAMGRMAIYIDKKKQIQKVGRNTGDRWLAWDLEDGRHKLTVRVESGWMRLFGVVFERDTGLVYDSLGVVGARASRWNNASRQHLERQLAHRSTNLVVFSYGGNSRNDRVTADKYLARYRKTIERLRSARPDEPCLVMSPTAHGVKKHGKVVHDEATRRMVRWQRRLAQEVGCAFFDADAWMKEVGDMEYWVRHKLVWQDRAHLTARGQSRLGQALYRAYLKGLQGYLEREGDGVSKGRAPAAQLGGP